MSVPVAMMNINLAHAVATAEGGRCNGESIEIEAEAGSQISPEVA
jgi:hypothetical protein